MKKTYKCIAKEYGMAKPGIAVIKMLILPMSVWIFYFIIG